MGLTGNYGSGRWTEEEGVAGRASSNGQSCRQGLVLRCSERCDCKESGLSTLALG